MNLYGGIIMTKTINQDNLNASVRMLDKIGETNLAQLKLVDAAQAERMEKLGELLKSQSFLDQFIACPDLQAAHKLFEDNGLLLSQEEMDGLMLQIKTFAKKLLDNDGVLSEEDLEQVAGGLSAGAINGGAIGVFFGVAAGFFKGSAIGASIGSVVPGFGTAVGGVIGAVVGALAGAGVGGGIGALVEWLFY